MRVWVSTRAEGMKVVTLIGGICEIREGILSRSSGSIARFAMMIMEYCGIALCDEQVVTHPSARC